MAELHGSQPPYHLQAGFCKESSKTKHLLRYDVGKNSSNRLHRLGLQKNDVNLQKLWMVVSSSSEWTRVSFLFSSSLVLILYNNLEKLISFLGLFLGIFWLRSDFKELYLKVKCSKNQLNFWETHKEYLRKCKKQSRCIEANYLFI